MSTMSELDIEYGISAGGGVTVEDIEGLLALPVGARIRDSAGDEQVMREDGRFDLHWRGAICASGTVTYDADEDEPEDADLPAVLLNPEILGEFTDPLPYKVGDKVFVSYCEPGSLASEKWTGVATVEQVSTSTVLGRPSISVRTLDGDKGAFAPRHLEPLTSLQPGDRVVKVTKRHYVADNARDRDYGEAEAKVGTVGTVTEDSSSLWGVKKGNIAYWVDWDNDNLGSVIGRSHLKAYVEPVIEESAWDDCVDDDLADWEKELLAANEPEFEDFSFEVGDRVFIAREFGEQSVFHGPATIYDVDPDGRNFAAESDKSGMGGRFFFDSRDIIVKLDPERVERFTINSDELPVVLDLEALEALPKGTVLLESVEHEGYPLAQRLDDGSWGRFNYATSESYNFSREIAGKVANGHPLFVAHLPQ